MPEVRSWVKATAVFCLLATQVSSMLNSLASMTSASTSTDIDKVVLDGDILLGGLFPIHSSSETGDSRCGRIDSPRGIQRMEAMIFTLQEINSNRSFLNYGRHTIALGGLLYDTCSKETYALEKALEFVKNSLTHEYDGEFVCQYPNGTQLPALRSSSRKHSKKPIRGVVGGAYSQVSVQVANLLRLFSIPQISYASTSAALSDKTRFEFFARTLPSDTEQAKALADIVKHFNWTFVSTVFSEGDYGEGGIQSFETEVDKLNVCIAERLLINLEPTKDKLDAIVTRLLSQLPRARVVVMFTREDHTEKFLDAVRRANVTENFVWISADGWGKSNLPVMNNTQVAGGALTLEISAGEVPNFNRYYSSLNHTQIRYFGPSKVSYTNPFFDEYSRDCSQEALLSNGSSLLNSSVRGLNVSGGIGAKPCQKQTIESGKFKQESKVPFVYDAVYTFAHGLKKVRDLVCSKQPDDADTKATDLFVSCVRNISSFPGREFYNLLISEENFFVKSILSTSYGSMHNWLHSELSGHNLSGYQDNESHLVAVTTDRRPPGPGARFLMASQRSCQTVPEEDTPAAAPAAGELQRLASPCGVMTDYPQYRELRQCMTERDRNRHGVNYRAEDLMSDERRLAAAPKLPILPSPRPHDQNPPLHLQFGPRSSGYDDAHKAYMKRSSGPQTERQQPRLRNGKGGATWRHLKFPMQPDGQRTQFLDGQVSLADGYRQQLALRPDLLEQHRQQQQLVANAASERIRQQAYDINRRPTAKRGMEYNNWRVMR